ncbi:MAG TPA: AAA family ATPase [Candidatus Sulfotelmatobacter sp.]|jgi:predicted kinase
MRKWMRERLQRRKKNTAPAPDQPAAPPLQPAYFDAEENASPADDGGKGAAETESPAAALESPASEDQGAGNIPQTSQEQPSDAPRTGSRTSSRRPRTESGGAGRTRRRGGRGRGGRGREQAVAQAFTPAAVKGSVQPAPTATSEEEAADTGEPQAEATEPVPISTPKVPAASARPPKGVVVLAIGLPGSGKSTWFKRHNLSPLSSDMVRSLLFDDVREQRYQDLVFSNLRSLLKARLIAKRPTNYVDATNLSPHERQHWIKLAKDYNYEVHAVFFDVPLEVCIERHQRRDRVVPEDVMRRMAAKLKPPSFGEGFAKITVVRVKKKQAEAEQPLPEA